MTAGQTGLDTTVGAFRRDNHAELKGAGKGPLAGLTFAARDVFHIAGHRTGFGNPDWLRTHPPASDTAVAVQQLLDAGADMVGRNLTACRWPCSMAVRWPFNRRASRQ